MGKKNLGKVSVIKLLSYVYFLLIYTILLIDVFFDVCRFQIYNRFLAVTFSFRVMKV